MFSFIYTYICIYIYIYIHLYSICTHVEHLYVTMARSSGAVHASKQARRWPRDPRCAIVKVFVKVFVKGVRKRYS